MEPGIVVDHRIWGQSREQGPSLRTASVAWWSPQITMKLTVKLRGGAEEHWQGMALPDTEEP